MNSKIKISIIIPVYNAEKYLDEAITSLTAQTLKDIEIICINDGSTDKSGDILARLAAKDSRIKVITRQNRGQSAARNTGIKIARGEFIGFLDADDRADNSAFEKLYNKSEDNDIVIGNTCTFNQTCGSCNYNDPYFSINIFPQHLFQKSFTPEECNYFLFRISVTPWNKIYRRSFIQENGFLFYENINFEDNLFFLETFLKAEKVALAKDAVFFYRIDSQTSYSHSNGENDYKKLDFFKIMDLEESILKKYGIYNNIVKSFKLHKKQTLFYWIKKIKNPLVYLKYSLKLFTTYPVYIIAGKPLLRLYFKHQIVKLLNLTGSYIWTEDTHTAFCDYVIRKIKIKNAVFLTNSDSLKEIKDFEVRNVKDVTPELVIAITSGFYNYDITVKEKLAESGIHAKVKKLIFPV